MNKKLAITSFWPLGEEILQAIQAAAVGYDIIDLQNNPSDGDLSQTEIVFGNVDSQTLAKMPNVKWIHAQTAGVEGFLSSEYNLPADVILTNSSGGYGISIAEYMLTTTLMLLRNAPAYFVKQQQKDWSAAGRAYNIYGAKVLVIGLGDIGGRFGQICHGLGAKTVDGVVRSPRSQKPDYIHKLYTIDDLDAAIVDADIIALALPGTGETAGVLTRARLAALKKGAVIVNVGRGSAIDQDALVDLLKAGHIGGAALDVTTPEPLPQDNPLWGLPNVIITPHISHGGRDNTAQLVVGKFVEYVEDYIAGRPFKKVVDRQAGY